MFGTIRKAFTDLPNAGNVQQDEVSRLNKALKKSGISMEVKVHNGQLKTADRRITVVEEQAKMIRREMDARVCGETRLVAATGAFDRAFADIRSDPSVSDAGMVLVFKEVKRLALEVLRGVDEKMKKIADSVELRRVTTKFTAHIDKALYDLFALEAPNLRV